MSTVFEIRDRLIEDFRSFSESFVSPKADDIAHYLSAENYKKRYWPDPLLQINPHYSQGETVSRLVDKGMLSEPCRRIFQRGGQSLTLYNHQERAISAASRGDSYVLTTGTGSGKSLSFFILKWGELDELPKDLLCKDVSNVGHHGNGEYQFEVSSESELELLIPLIRKALMKKTG